MHEIESPVSRGLVLVCDKCGKRLKSDHDDNPSRLLVSKLKKTSRDLFEKGEFRAALTSCLNICPKDRISVAIVETNGSGSKPRFFTVKADDLGDISDKILKEVHRSVAAPGHD
jgi:predicted metal-binding protein